MNTKASSNKWLQYYRDVARMRLDIEVLREDVNFEKKHGTNLYAVDTNVLIFYANPIDNKEQARTFMDEKEAILEGLAICLADILFFNGLVAKDEGALLFPPSLLDEFLNNYQHYALLANLEEDKLSDELDNVDEIKHLINKYQSKNISKDDLVSYLINHCPNLVRYLHEKNYKGATSIIQRLGRIGSESRLRNMDQHQLIPIIDEKTKIANKKKWNNLKQFIRNKEKKRKTKISDQRTSKNIDDDITTLSWIASINDELEQQPAILSKKRVRLLYISADVYIHEFANELAESKEINFNFLRHPRQYIQFIRHSKKKSTTDIKSKDELLKEFMLPVDVFLQPFNVHGSNYLKNLISFTKCKHDFKIGEAIDALNQVERGVQFEQLNKKRMELLTLSSLSRALTLTEMASDLAKEMCENGIDQLLKKRRDKTFGGVVTTLCNLGLLGYIAEFRELIEEYFQKLNINHKNGYWCRGPVSLRRDKDRIGHEGFFEQIHSASFEKNWINLFKLISTPKKSPYIRYLVFALVAADAGKWRKAREYCSKALEVTTDNKIHEALYFLAVALRHDCQNHKDYEEAKTKLKECTKVWEKRYPSRIDLRFNSERLSLETAYFNYKKFSKWEKIKDNSREPKLLSTWKKLSTLANKIDNLSYSDEQEVICLRIKRQVYSNQCCLFIFDQYIGEEELKNQKQEGRLAYDNLQKLMVGKKFRPSYFIHFLVAFFEWHLAKDADKENLKENALTETLKALKASTIPYEDNKFSHFQKVLENNGRLDS